MRTKIISAFPGTGKSYYHNLHPDTTLDSDSSEFSWQYDAVTGEKLRNSWFPKNYIEHIQKNVGKYEIIFVSSHKEVREALKDASLFHYVVYPRQCDKEMFKQRYIKRGSPEPFVNLWFLSIFTNLYLLPLIGSSAKLKSTLLTSFE